MTDVNRFRLTIASLLDGLSFALHCLTDILLCCELGTTTRTKLPQGGAYTAHWTCASDPTFGQAVGAFFSRSLDGDWLPLTEISDGCNIQFYLATPGTGQLILGSFYAPHRGHSNLSRLNFFKRLYRLMCRARSKYPRAWMILGGDANLPGLFLDASKQIRCIAKATSKVEKKS